MSSNQHQIERIAGGLPAHPFRVSIGRFGSDRHASMTNHGLTIGDGIGPGREVIHVLGGVAQSMEGARLLAQAQARLRAQATPGTPESERVPSARRPGSSKPRIPSAAVDQAGALKRFDEAFEGLKRLASRIPLAVVVGVDSFPSGTQKQNVYFQKWLRMPLAEKEDTFGREHGDRHHFMSVPQRELAGEILDRARAAGATCKKNLQVQNPEIRKVPSGRVRGGDFSLRSMREGAGRAERGRSGRFVQKKSGKQIARGGPR